MNRQDYLFSNNFPLERFLFFDGTDRDDAKCSMNIVLFEHRLIVLFCVFYSFLGRYPCGKGDMMSFTHFPLTEENDMPKAQRERREYIDNYNVLIQWCRILE